MAPQGHLRVNRARVGDADLAAFDVPGAAPEEVAAAFPAKTRATYSGINK